MTKKIFVVIGATGLCLVACCLPGKQYDVLNIIADTKTVGDNIQQLEQFEVDMASSNVEYLMKRLQNIEYSKREELLQSSISLRPEYNPNDYLDVSKIELKDIDISSWEKIGDKEVDRYIRKEMIQQNIYTEKTLPELHDIVNVKYSIRKKNENTPFIDVKDSDEFVGANAFPDEVNKKLLTTKEGESFILECNHPSNKELCVYEIQVNKIKGLDITNEIVDSISMGRYKNVKSYKSHIKTLLENESIKRIARKNLDNSLSDILYVSKYPEETVKFDIEEACINYQRMNNMNTIDDKVVKDISDKAVKNLKAEIRVLALLKKYNLWLDNDALDTEIKKRKLYNKNKEEVSYYYAQYIIGRESLVKEILKNG